MGCVEWGEGRRWALLWGVLSGVKAGSWLYCGVC